MDKTSRANLVHELHYYNISNFSCCRLIDNGDILNLKCSICMKVKKANKTLMCGTCNISCCTECYDHHRKEQFISALQKFQKKNQVNIQLSKCGNFFKPKFKAENENCFSEEKQGFYVENAAQSAITDFPETNIVFFNSDFSTSMFLTSKIFTYETVKAVVSLLKKTYGAVSELMFDGDGSFKCMYFQDSEMKDFFNFYPKRVCIDVTCTLLSLNLVLYLFLGEDSNGQSEIISGALICVEDLESLTWLLTMFKKHNPSWREIKLLIVDSLIRNREILKSCFPDANILICFYHSTRTLKRDIDGKEFSNILNEDKISITKHFEKMVLVYSEMEYSLLHQQLFSIYNCVQDYFDKNWHPIRHEWRLRIEYCENILYAIDGFLNFIEHFIKPILSVQTTLPNFFQNIFFIIKLLRTERSHRNPMLRQAAQLSFYSKFSPQYHISKLLTAYSAEFVIHQLDISAEISINPGMLLDSYVFCRFGTTAVANSSACTCKFFLLTSLFCCHIFAVRRALSLLLFDTVNCDITWTQKYFQDAHNALESSSQRLQKDSKYSFTVFDNLSFAMLNCMLGVFDHRLSLINQLVLSWKKSEVYLQFNGIEKAEFQNNETALCTIAEQNFNNEDSHITDELISSATCSSKLLALTDKQSGVQESPRPNFLIVECKLGTRLLEGVKINFAYLSRVICKTKESCIEWLQYLELLPKLMSCPACGHTMKHEYVTRLSDGIIWICTSITKNKKSCAKRCSVRRGTWLEATNMPLDQILYFTYMWINCYPASQIVFELGISSATFSVWDKFFRRVCLSTLQNNQPLDFDSESLLDVWRQSTNEQDEFIAFLKDASISHELAGHNIQSM